MEFEALAAVMNQQAFALPSFATGGPFLGKPGRLLQAERLSPGERLALATLYLVLMTQLLIDLLDARGD